MNFFAIRSCKTSKLQGYELKLKLLQKKTTKLRDSTACGVKLHISPVANI